MFPNNRIISKLNARKEPVTGYFSKETVDAVFAVAPQFPVSVNTGKYRVWQHSGEYSYELTIHTDLLDPGEFWQAVEAHKQAPADTEAA